MVELRPYEKLHTIQMLKDVVRKWWGVELAFADDKGYVLEHATGNIIPPNNEFCRLALFSKEGFKRCNESVKVARDRLRDGGGRRIGRCIVHECHLGFDVVACPLVIEGEFVGFLFVGGSVHEDLTSFGQETLVRKIKEITVGNAATAMDTEKALRGLPRVAERELEKLADLLEYGATQVQEYAAETIRRERELQAMNKQLGERYRFENIIGSSPSMQEVFRLLEKIIESDSTVLINGESGTGKELIARAIHFSGPRGKRPFVVQNCSAFNDNLLESALFGHAKGSFTGAIRDKKGLFEIADGGTFFLDEVGDMSPTLQVKLLRVLQEGTFTPVGATESREVDVRVIAATHKDLHKMVERGEFREDLYYRINVIRVQLPAMRERLDDLPLLVDHFLRKHHRIAPRPAGATTAPRRAPRLADDALSVFQRYPWPGNIRELENEVERLIVLGADLDELPASLISARVREAVAGQATPRSSSLLSGKLRGSTTLKGAVESVEREMIREGLVRTHWNKSQLAKELGISRSNLIAKVREYNLEDRDDQT